MVRSRSELVVKPDGALQVTVSVTMTELAERCGCRVEVVRRMVDYGLVDPVQGPPERPRFSLVAAPRICRALRLKRDLGLNINSLALVMELLDRIEELEKKL